jgi:1,3-beta-glucan synthase
MKQSKLRKRRVWRYAVIYFVLFVVFLALLVGPLIVGKMLLTDSLTSSIPMKLYQPTGQDNNDTLGYNQTGTGCTTCTTAGATGSTSTSTAAARVRLF